MKDMSEYTNEELLAAITIIPEMKISVLVQVQWALVDGDDISEHEDHLNKLDKSYDACMAELQKRNSPIESALSRASGEVDDA